MMKKLLAGLGALAGFVVLVLALVAVLVFTSPREHTVTGSVLIDKPQAEVFEAATNLDTRSDWAPMLVKLHKTDDRHWKEETEWGDTMAFEVVQHDPPTLHKVNIANADELGFGGSWTWKLEPHGKGTRVSITEDGYVDNILFRVMSHYVFGQESNIKATLEAFAKHMGESNPSVTFAN